MGTKHHQDLLKTVPVDTIDSIKLPANTPSLVNGRQKLTKNKLVSILLPMPIRSVSNGLLEQKTSQVEDFFPQMMMSMIKNMAEHARKIMEFSQKSDENDLFRKPNIKDDSLSTNVQGQISFDPKTGESVSVQHSMSVMMTKDNDGHNKMIVMRTPPKITIHRDLFRK